MITENFVESSIASEHYFTAADGRSGAIANGTYAGVERPLANDRDLEALAHVTVCILIMNNGYKVYGVNTGSIDPTRFNAEVGRQLPESAVRQSHVEAVDRLHRRADGRPAARPRQLPDAARSQA